MKKLFRIGHFLAAFRLGALGFVLIPAVAFFIQTYPKATDTEAPVVIASEPEIIEEQPEPIKKAPEPEPKEEEVVPEPIPSVRAGYVAGITIDQIDKLSTIIESLQKFPTRPTTRIVFDEYIPPSTYANTVNQVSAVSDIMGEILDSFYVKDYSLDEYQQRAKDYVAAFGNKVDIWEIGNEVNGEWLLNDGEERSVVVDKVEAAYDEVQKIGGQTAITLYYNPNCWEDPKHEMFRWVDNELSKKLKNGVDYVWLSYWDEDCNFYNPNWSEVFNKVGDHFPNAKIGIGEAGMTNASKRTEYMEKYYQLEVSHPRYVGGVFWWYYWQDVVDPLSNNNQKPLNTIINSLYR